ncbi:glutathione S-transferase [Salinicola tamaricis]|uniref:glutathione S-transferase n=1 Tax=Salinicola tamaricis TaxID=1771309 RepID=UPI0030F3EC29
MTYRLFIANKNYSSWSMRPWVLLRALEIPFEEVMTPFEGDGQQSAFATFSPTAKVPCLHDGDSVVWESLAIIDYIAEDHPQSWPQAREARTWARCASAEMHAGFPALRNECSMNCALRIDLGEPGAALARDIARLEALWQEGITRFGGPWLAGEQFTAVDAMFAPVAVRVRGYGITLGSPSATTSSVCWRTRRWRAGSNRASPSPGSTAPTRPTASAGARSSKTAASRCNASAPGRLASRAGHANRWPHASPAPSALARAPFCHAALLVTPARSATRCAPRSLLCLVPDTCSTAWDDPPEPDRRGFRLRAPHPVTFHACRLEPYTLYAVYNLLPHSA